MNKVALISTLLVSWSAGSGVSAAGYRILVGNAPGSYQQTIDVGNKLTGEVPNVDLSVPTFIAVKAYNQFGESDSVQVPPVGKPSAPGSVSVSVKPGQ